MALISPDLSGIVDGATPGASAWTTPMNTIINAINGNLDTNNFTINGTNLSTIASPVAWTVFVPTITGGTSPTTNCSYQVLGKTLIMRVVVACTSTTAGFFFSLPFNAKYTQNIPIGRVQDNSVVSNSIGLVQTAAGSNSVSVFTSLGGAGWTTSGTKGLECQLICEIS